MAVFDPAGIIRPPNCGESANCESHLRHSTGRVHDFKVYKMKHPTFPKNLPSQDGSARKGGRVNLRSYGDRGYQGAQKVDPDVEVVLPIRRKPGKELSPEEREINRLQSKVGSMWKMRSAGSKHT